MKSFILLDRSGSMALAWEETLGGLNAFAKKLAEDTPKAKITVAAFDSAGFDIIRGKSPAAKWKNITSDEVSPRSMTPLFDAIGKFAGVVSGKKASVLILTDGAENNSVETSKDGARKIVEGWKVKGFDVVYIGADFDAFGEASGLGIGHGQTLNASKAKMGDTMAAYATRTAAFAASGDAKASWSDETRKRVS